jgi:hypothetical protein
MVTSSTGGRTGAQLKVKPVVWRCRLHRTPCAEIAKGDRSGGVADERGGHGELHDERPVPFVMVTDLLPIVGHIVVALAEPTNREDSRGRSGPLSTDDLAGKARDRRWYCW